MTTVPGGPVQHVVVSNVTDDAGTIAVMISWNSPADSNGFIRYYRIVYQQTLELFHDAISSGSGSGNSSSNDNIGCPPINSTKLEKRTLYNGTTEPPTMIRLDGLS